jgi:predicted negative regulator of RcsB-dependent stress response
MATHLDLEEQEQLDQLKAFWSRFGPVLTWVLIAALGCYAAWNAWSWWQRDQAGQAAGIYDELDKAARLGDADQAARIFADLKERHPHTTYAQQGALLAAKVEFDKGKADAALGTLEWLAANGSDDDYRAVARLRAAALQLEQKKYDEALKSLDAVTQPQFLALADDRRGDVLLAQGKKDDARAAYDKAWRAMDAKLQYRRLIEAKLTALGAAPAAASAASGAGL